MHSESISEKLPFAKPIKNLELNSLQWETAYLDALILDPDLFPSVKWEDNEPTKVIIRLA